MKNTNHWFPFFWNDYVNDTLQLTMLQHGAYLGCLLACYRSGNGLPSDLSSIFRCVGAFTSDEQKAVEFILEKFFKKQDDNSYRHSRVDLELKRIAERRASAKAAIDTRWKKEKNTAVHTAERTTEHTGEDTAVYTDLIQTTTTTTKEGDENSQNEDQVVVVVSSLEAKHMADIGPWGDKYKVQMKAWITQYGEAFMDKAITLAKAEGFDENVKSRIAIVVTTYLPQSIAQLLAKREQVEQKKKEDEIQEAAIERDTREIVARRDRVSAVQAATSEVSADDIFGN
jgi:uncharacterized protein YdaU (DUF1376 family)